VADFQLPDDAPFRVQAADDLGPLGYEGLLFHADFEFALKNQSKEAAEDVTADGFVALMKGARRLYSSERTVFSNQYKCALTPKK
jgi:hypothetical protein